MNPLTSQRDQLDRQAEEIQRQINQVGQGAEVIRTTVQVGIEVAPQVQERYQNYQQGRETRREAERLERSTEVKTEQVGRAGDGEFRSTRVPVAQPDPQVPARLPESNRVIPPTLPTDAPLPSVEDLRRQGQDAFNERRARATDQRIIDTHNRYLNSGGFEAERQAEAARREAVRQEELARTTERQRQNAERLGSDYEQRIRQAELNRQIRQLRERELAETAIRESQRRDFERRRQYEADGGIEGERRRAIAEAEARRNAVREQTLTQQRYERETLQPRRAAEAREAELLATARRQRDAELAETAARVRARELAENETRRRAEDSANRLLNDWRTRQEFGEIQNQQKVRQKAKELGFDVQKPAREADRINRQIPTSQPRPPVTNPESDYIRRRGNGIEDVKRVPFDSPSRPDIPIGKPPLDLRPAPTPDRLPPLRFAEPPKTKLNFGLDLPPAPDFGENMTRRGIPPGSMKPFVPRIPEFPSPKPIFPGFPNTNLPIRLPKGTKGNLVGDLVFDLLFPEPLNTGEDEALEQIARDRARDKLPIEQVNRFPAVGRGVLIVSWKDCFNESLNSSTLNYNYVVDFIRKYDIYETTTGLVGLGRAVAKMYDGDPIAGYTDWRFLTPFGVARGGVPLSTPIRNPVIIGFIPANSPELEPGIDIDPIEGLRLPGLGTITPKIPATPGQPTPGQPTPQWQIKPPSEGNPILPQWRPKPVPANRPDAPYKPWDDPENPLEVVPPTTPENPPLPEDNPNQFPQNVPLPPYQEFRRGRIYIERGRRFKRFPDLLTQTETQLDCKDGDCVSCRFNLAQIREVVISELRTQLKQETKIKKWNEEADKIEDKTAFLFATAETVPAIKDLYSELAELRKQKPIVTVPDRFKTRVPDARPQMVILYREVGPKANGYYQVVVPWAGNTKPNATTYKKGDKMTIYEMADSSKIVVNAFTQAEGERVIKAFLPLIPIDKRKGAHFTTSCRSDKLKTITVKPVRADYYKQGLAGSLQPDKRHYYS